MTTYGKLYGYNEEAIEKWNWEAIDGVLFRGGYVGNNLNIDKAIPIALRMVQEQFELPLTNVWRVLVNNDGTVELNDFTLPSSSGKMRDVFKQENLPEWIQDSLSVLMIVDQGVTVEGVGKKITDSIFYLMETPEIGEIYGNKA
jgi:hypothetical protein